MPDPLTASALAMLALEPIRSEAFPHLHRSLKLDDTRLRQCFAEGDVCQALGPALADAVPSKPPCSTKHSTESSNAH